MRNDWRGLAGILGGLLLVTPLGGVAASTAELIGPGEPGESDGGSAGLPTPSTDGESWLLEAARGTRFRTVYRVDQFDWSIAGGGVNVLSELTWDDVHHAGVEVDTRLDLPRGFDLTGRLGLSMIRAGDNQDSDYFGDDRTLEFSRSNNASDDGWSLDSQVGIGYAFELTPELSLSPLAGYALRIQHLTITDGLQTIPDLGPFGGLDSSYRATWHGPWVGAQLGYRSDEKLALRLTAEHHFAFYHASANWNLRSDFAHPESFVHDATGTGWVLSANVDWRVTQRWTVELGVHHLAFSTRPGTDKIFFANGSTVSTRLNEVNWESTRFSLGARLHF